MKTSENYPWIQKETSGLKRLEDVLKLSARKMLRNDSWSNFTNIKKKMHWGCASSSLASFFFKVFALHSLLLEFCDVVTYIRREENGLIVIINQGTCIKNSETCCGAFLLLLSFFTLMIEAWLVTRNKKP